MKHTILRDAFSYIDDRFLDLAERPPRSKKIWLRWTAAAACLCVAVGAAALLISRQPQVPDGVSADLPPVSLPDPVDDASVQNPDGSGSSLRTSDTYDTLEELLEALSDGESHADVDQAASEGGGATASALTEAASEVSHGGYRYHKDDDADAVRIYNMDGSEVGLLNFAADANIPQNRDWESGFVADVFLDGLLLLDDRLLVVGAHTEGESELDYGWITDVLVYDLTSPLSPALLHRFTQSGELTACYLTDGVLTLLTTDGVCACGWSRLDDTADYVPRLSADGEAVAWGDADIAILGEPTRVQYLAVSGIDVDSGEVLDKQAFYGDVARSFHGDGWLALSVTNSGRSRLTHPVLYTFDTAGGIAFTGKISTAAVFGLPASAELEDYAWTAGDYPQLLSVSKAGDTYRLFGEYTRHNGESFKTDLFAATADMNSGEYASEIFDSAAYPRLSVYEVAWEEQKAVIVVRTLHDDDPDFWEKNHFLFVEFDGGIRFVESGIVAGDVSGVEGIYWDAEPFGYIYSLLPMGDGIYLRYSGTSNGFDVYDFSDTANPRRVYEAPDDGLVLFDFDNVIYDGDTFGVLAMYPGPDGGYMRGGIHAWRVYDVDATAAEPLTLAAEYPIHQDGTEGPAPDAAASDDALASAADDAADISDTVDVFEGTE